MVSLPIVYYIDCSLSIPRNFLQCLLFMISFVVGQFTFIRKVFLLNALVKVLTNNTDK